MAVRLPGFCTGRRTPPSPNVELKNAGVLKDAQSLDLSPSDGQCRSACRRMLGVAAVGRTGPYQHSMHFMAGLDSSISRNLSWPRAVYPERVDWSLECACSADLLIPPTTRH